jgi:hypothetical protein
MQHKAKYGMEQTSAAYNVLVSQTYLMARKRSKAHRMLSYHMHYVQTGPHQHASIVVSP